MAPEGFYFDTPAGSGGPLPHKFINLDERISEMDERGISVQVLSLSQPMVYWTDAKTSLELARAWNDGASAAHLRHSDRLTFFMTLPMLDEDMALDELQRAGSLPGARGVYLGTNINGIDLSHPRFSAVFAAIEALGLPVFLHPLQAVGGDRLKPYLLYNSIGYPVDTAIAAAHLIFGGVLDRFPNLTFNLAHAGGALPILMGRIDHSHRVSKAAQGLTSNPSSYLRRFTYDTIAHSLPILEFVISQVGVDRLMIGSDYCFAIGCDHPAQLVMDLNISDADRNLILHGNAERFLNVSSLIKAQ
jgi:aminocarboxymuconate-semialdehyde decarboxylase